MTLVMLDVWGTGLPGCLILVAAAVRCGGMFVCFVGGVWIRFVLMHTFDLGVMGGCVQKLESCEEIEFSMQVVVERLRERKRAI